jgi:hypothetical protein
METKKKILASQIELLNIKENNIKTAQEQIRKMFQDMQNKKMQIMIELGIPQDDVNNWQFSEDGKFFIRKKTEPTKTTVKEKNGNKRKK